jgi:hypothetical protein
MTVLELVQTVVNLRRVNQPATLAFSGGCEPSTDIVLHGGEVIARAGRTRVYAGGYASIQTYSTKDKSLSSHGFERQGPLLEAVSRDAERLGRCASVLVSLSATAEGGCGDETIAVTLDQTGKVASVGPVHGTDCQR